MRALLGFTLVVVLLAGCGPASTVVPLGKVVVYRNGVAYFEREARVVGRSLALSVPRAKVDDFLKSLTVRDKATGRSLPVSFPSSTGAGTSGNGGVIIEMVVTLPVEDGTDVVLSYITESPAWKPSYRVVMSEDGEVELEGWAIVDNTSGENWQDVVVGVGSSSALSFRYDLWSIRDVERQALGGEQSFAIAPPTGASPYGGADPAAAPLEQLNDGEIVIESAAPTIDQGFSNSGVATSSDYTQNLPVPGRTFESVVGSAAGEGSPGGVSFAGSTSLENSYAVEGVNTSAGLSQKEHAKRAEEQRIAAEKSARQVAELEAHRGRIDRRNEALAEQIKRGKQPVTVEGYSPIGDKDAAANSAARANIVRNNLIERGVPPALIIAKGMGAREGVPAGVRVVAANQAAAKLGADAPPVGESHFGSKSAMTVQRGTSAMVSIVKSKTAGEVVYLYDSESERGNETFAFKAIRMSNPTKNTLEAGPVTVYGESRFIGEGLMDPIPPESIALIPFALDRQIVVEKKLERSDHISSLVRLSRGILTTEVEHTRTTSMDITNRMPRPVTVYVRHTVTDGWQLRDAPKDIERLGDARLFAVRLGARATERLTIRETTPMQKLVDLRDESTFEMLSIFMSDASEANLSAVKPLMALHREMANSVEKIESLRDRLVDYRSRMDELHAQIFSLKAVKSGGSLMRHLKQKMREISDKVQANTIELVDTQETLMVARVRFQDALAELSLASLITKPARAANAP